VPTYGAGGVKRADDRGQKMGVRCQDSESKSEEGEGKSYGLQVAGYALVVNGYWSFVSDRPQNSVFGQE